MYSVKIKIYRVDSLATYAYSCRICLLEFFYLFLGLKSNENFQQANVTATYTCMLQMKATLCYSFAWQIFAVRIAWQASGLQDSLRNTWHSKSLYNTWLRFERRGNLHESGHSWFMYRVQPRRRKYLNRLDELQIQESVMATENVFNA